MISLENVVPFRQEASNPIETPRSGMPKSKSSAPTGWDSLIGDPWTQPYGLPLFRGEKVSVSYGRLIRSFWYEHTYESVRLLFTFNHARGLIESTQGDENRVPSALLGAHKFCIIPPGLETTLDWAESADLVVLYDESGVFEDLGSLLTDVWAGDFRVLQRRDSCLSQLANIFQGLCRQVEKPQPAFVEGIGVALGTRALQKVFLSGAPAANNRSGLPSDTVAKLNHYIDTHVADAIRTKDLARQVCLSADHFARRFKISTDIAPKQYVLKRKVEKVRELLESGRYNVSQAATEVGFHDLSHLNRCFRKFFGCSPKTILKTVLPTDSYKTRTDAAMDASRE